LRAVYSATSAPVICLRAVSKSAKPKRFRPLCSNDTLGARIGPWPSAIEARSLNDLPLADGKSAGRPVGSGWGGGRSSCLAPPQPEATAAASNGAKIQRRGRRTRPESRHN
jgi:hypothetical protein